MNVMRLPIMIRTLLIFILLSMSGVVTADSTQSWVVGSYVNVRVQPSRTAEVIDHLTANTPVMLLSRQEDFCEISWGGNRQGFVSCKLLGEEALSIDEVGTKRYLPDGTLPPQFHAPRAFWLEPTVERLFDAGEHFRQVMLPAERLNVEECFDHIGVVGIGCEVDKATPELKRFPIPEFEAMKTLLAEGLIAPHSQYTPLVSWQSIRNTVSNLKDLYGDRYSSYTSEDSVQIHSITPHLWLGRGGNYTQMYQQIPMPPAQPSFFKKVSDIGRPSASAEELSAQYQIPHQMAVLDKPTWGGEANRWVLLGSWDIGTVTSRLTQPVYEVSISHQGQVAVGETEAETKRLRNEWWIRCGGQEFLQGSPQKLLPGYKKIKQPWIFFRLIAPPAITKARVRINDLNKGYENTNIGTPFGVDTLLQGKPTTAQIDLDLDGIDDLFVWDDGGNGETEYDKNLNRKKVTINYADASYQRTRLIFANVAGEWYLLDTDDEHACD